MSDHVSCSLTLKNLYAVIKQKDYPVYSDGVLSRSNSKGLTLLGFWRQNLIPAWRETPCGIRIWREEGGKNRFPSELCNRKAAFPYYREYTEELLNRLNPEQYLEEISLFEQFLSGRNYNHEVLSRKLLCFLDMLPEQDKKTGPDLPDYFRPYLTEEMPGYSKLFLDSWLLTALTLHAISGEYINCPGMQELRKTDSYLPEQLAEMRGDNRPFGNAGSVSILTDQNCRIWANILEEEAFFGREKELFDLEDAVRSRGKVLISGMEGTGKTELLRKLLLRLMRNGRVEAVAAVQYRNSLKDSISEAFSGLQGADTEERYRESIRKLSGKKTGTGNLLIIEDLNAAPGDETVLKELSALSCTVLITSEADRLTGFQTYAVGDLDLQAAALVFRNNYGRVLSEEEVTLLEHHLQRDRIRHPLTLRLLGRLAGTRDWTIPVLEEHIPELSLGSSVCGEEWKECCRAAYQELYRQGDLTDRELYLLRFFAVFPFCSLSSRQVAGYLRMKDSRTVADLEHMAALGWLEKDRRGYSLHTLPAQSIPDGPLSEQELGSFLEYCAGIAERGPQEEAPEDTERETIRSLLRAAAGGSHGEPGSELTDLLQRF